MNTNNIIENTKPLVIAFGLSIFTFFIGAFAGRALYTAPQPLNFEDLEKVANGNQQVQSTSIESFAKVTDQDLYRGSKDAKVILIEYSDLECPFCQKFHLTVMDLLEKYDGELAWVFRHFPLAIHEGALPKAEAAQCVFELSGNETAWEFVDQVISNTSTPVENLSSIAESLGVDKLSFEACLEEGREEKIKEVFDTGVEAGVQGTPGSIIYNTKTGEAQLVEGSLPYNMFVEIIDEELAK